MGARWILNLVLALLLAGLGIAIRQELAGEALPQTLTGIDAADLRRIEVEREGEPRIRLERTAQTWHMVEPLSVEADQGHLDKLLGILAAPVQRSFPQGAAAPAELGLAPSKLKLRLDSLTLAFGGLDPLGQRRYVAADGVVHLVEDRFYHLLIAPAIDYVSRAPLPSDHPPAFATLKGVPLASDSLQTLAKLRAERVEPLGTDLAGEPLQVKFPDGSALRFLLSEDRRRWSRLDLKLRYVIADPPLLALDPAAIDPTPPQPAAAALSPDRSTSPPESAHEPDARGLAEGEAGGAGPGPVGPLVPTSDGEIPAAEGETPPEVRLSPQGPGAPRGHRGQDADEPGQVGFGAEPGKRPPQGFGMDPFAPDPAYDPELAPDGH